MSEVLEFNPDSQYKLRLTDGGSWAPTEITGGAVHQAKNLQYSVKPEWFDDAPEDAEGVTVEPLSDGGWGVFKGGEQIGSMSDDDVKPLEKSAIPEGAPEPKAPPAAPASAPSAAKDDGDQEDDDAPRRAASIGPDADGDGWVDGKEPLMPGSVDMPPLLPGRNMEKALAAAVEDFSAGDPGEGLREALPGHFLPTTGASEADMQIRAYEDSHLKNFNSLLEAPEKSFMTGPILHNLTATEDAGERAAEVLADARGGLESLYSEGVGDPTLDQRMNEVAASLSTLTETGDAVQRLGQGLARNGDAYNSITQSMATGVQDAFAQISAYAKEHDKWETSGSSAAEPRPDFSFLKSELESAVGDAQDLLEGTIASETMLASATLDPAAGESEDKMGPPNEGGSTPAASGGTGEGENLPGPRNPAPAAPQQGGSTPAASSPASSGSSEEASSGKGGPNRDAAEKLAGLLSSSGGEAAPQPGGMAPQMPQPSFQQQPFPMPNLDHGAAAQQAMPTAPVSAPSAGLIETEDPYEALLNPATHLTRGFEAGDMQQIREGNASGRDAAMIRPYTAEARSADAMLTSPPAAGPGASTPRPSALGADMKPLDRDGDGKVDKDAIPATAENVTGEEVPTAVMIDGEPHDVKISDPRLLEMMNLVGEATEDEPLGILNAAAEAGIELESYGEMLEDPTEAKAGDVVISSKGSGFYLGDGNVLLESDEVVPLSEVLELRPPQSGIFRLELPELPDEVDHGDENNEDQEREDEAAAEPSEGGDVPPAEAAPAGEPAEPAAPAEGGAAPVDPQPEVLPAADFEAGEMPDPAIAPEHQDLDGDGIPDDNNGNGLIDTEEPLPEPEAPVAEDPAPAPEAPAPEVEEAPAPVPEDLEPEPEQAPEAPEAPEPLFEGTASLDLDGGGLRATGEATARIEDVPFEGEAFGRG